MSGHGAPVRLLATLPDGLVASWGEDATLRLWDVASGTQVCASVPTGAVAVTALAAVEDWCVVTGDADGMVQMWDLATGAAVGAPMRGHDGSVTSVVSMPTAAGDTQVVSADRAGMLWQWDPATGVGHCRTSTFGASSTAIPLPDGGALMASIRPFTIQTWDPATGKPAGRIRTRLPNDAIMVALSGPNGRPLLARSSGRAGSGPEAFVYDPMTGAQYSGVFSVPAGDLTDLISHLAAVPGPDGHDLLACGGRHGAIQLWDPVSGTAIGEPLTGHSALSALGHTIPTTPLAELSVLPGAMIVPAVNVLGAEALIDMVSAPANREVLERIRQVRDGGAHLAAAHTGAFYLAEAGVLDGASATTSCGSVRVFGADRHQQRQRAMPGLLGGIDDEVPSESQQDAVRGQ
ncbi:hypothetical protein OG563_07355 [Nocardia vinacea]|uniref:WD40 repeat domain-containing protein n=1 Tax=Nocardia vinacea TaxID=96468 RepID=A0ABZ1Z1W6_9NOCA|nr:hypothetical protein [Nocardia vinacea]